MNITDNTHNKTKITRSTDNRIAGSPDKRIIGLPDRRMTGSPAHMITGSPDHQAEIIGNNKRSITPKYKQQNKTSKAKQT